MVRGSKVILDAPSVTASVLMSIFSGKKMKFTMQENFFTHLPLSSF